MLMLLFTGNFPALMSQDVGREKVLLMTFSTPVNCFTIMLLARISFTDIHSSVCGLMLILIGALGGI